ncbi:MAG: recombinase family protein [Gaiellaceae bacterium]
MALALDGYLRVSRIGGRNGETFISPAAQREKIEAHARAHGYSVAAWHEDLDESGSKASRPGFQKALARVERGETGGIIVAKLDRFARSVADAADAIRRIRSAGGELVSVEDGFDSSTPMGKFAVHMILALAELELDRIRENWLTAHEFAVRRGVHVASRTPTGYRRRADGRLEPDPRAAPVVARLFREKAAGASLKELARLLMEASVVGPYGNPNWTSGAVAKLLANPVYTGEARAGKYRNPEAHPAIVAPAEWRAAQSKRLAQPTSAKGDGSLLAGLLRCAGCRYVMKADKMTLRDGSRVRIYRCRGEHAAGACQLRSSVMGRIIEPYVVEQFFQALGPNGLLARASTPSGGVDALKARLADAEAELLAWLDETSIADLGRDLYVRGLEARKRRRDQIEAELEGVLDASGAEGLPNEVELRTLWPELSNSERRRLLAAGIDAIMLRRGQGRSIEERGLILWHGEAPADFPSRGRRYPLAPFRWPDERDLQAAVAVA